MNHHFCSECGAFFTGKENLCPVCNPESTCELLKSDGKGPLKVENKYFVSTGGIPDGLHNLAFLFLTISHADDDVLTEEEIEETVGTFKILLGDPSSYRPDEARIYVTEAHQWYLREKKFDNLVGTFEEAAEAFFFDNLGWPGMIGTDARALKMRFDNPQAQAVRNDIYGFLKNKVEADDKKTDLESRLLKILADKLFIDK
tara:strand:+ start:243 stop:845 length:603 start_codon:yes stop_codon:yes gene_type:complete